MLGTDLLRREPDRTGADPRVRRANLCRCTGYTGIVDAIAASAEANRTAGRSAGPEVTA